jgi:hypothetical protein
VEKPGPLDQIWIRSDQIGSDPGQAPNCLVAGRVRDTVCTSMPGAAPVVAEGVPHPITQRVNNR